MAAGDLLYVYGIVPGEPAVLERVRTAGLTGIGGRTVEILSAGALAAVVSPVPAAEFDEEPLNRHLRDLDWLGPHAAAHQGVNAGLHSLSDALLPLSFGTIFRSRERIRAVLVEQSDELRRRLAEVAGREEWVLAMHKSPAVALAAVDAASERVRELLREIEVSPPGRAYLLRRRLDQLRRDEALRIELQAAEEALGAAAEVAERAHREPLAARTDQPAADPQVVARASLLLRRGDSVRLQAASRAFDAQWGERGFSIHLTGPWPPYRFGGSRLA